MQSTRSKMQILVGWLVMKGLTIHLALPSGMSQTCKTGRRRRTGAKMKKRAKRKYREIDEHPDKDADPGWLLSDGKLSCPPGAAVWHVSDLHTGGEDAGLGEDEEQG